jgi:hypothetical protein
MRRSTVQRPDVTWRVGFMDDVTANPPSNGIYFDLRLDSSQAVMRFYAVTRASGISTETDTGIADSINYNRIQIRRNATNGTIEFYINGILRATHDGNVLSTVVPLNLAMQMQSNSGGNALIDYVSLCFSGLNR